MGLAGLANIVSRDKGIPAVRATPVPGHGELTILINAFNEMLEQISQSEKDSENRLMMGWSIVSRNVQQSSREAKEGSGGLFQFAVVRAKEEVERASKFQGSISLHDEPRAANST